MLKKAFAKLMVPVALLGGLMLAPAVFSESLEEEEFWAGQEKDVKRDSNYEYAERTCGVAIPLTFVKSSFGGIPSDYSPYSHCLTTHSALAGLCDGSPAAKARVTQKIKSVECSLGGAGKQKISIEGGVLKYALDVDAPNAGETMTQFLRKNL